MPHKSWNELRILEGEEIFIEFAELLSSLGRSELPAALLKGLSSSYIRSKNYKLVEIPKKRGGARQLTIPSPVLKSLQRRLLILFSELGNPHKSANGFIKGKGIVPHASFHTGRASVYILDLKDFFPSITWPRIFGMFKLFPFQCSKPLASVVANWVTYNDCLPQGAPTSPFISNMICRTLDRRLYGWAMKNGYRYSRYADDLTFSTNRKNIPVTHREEIKAIIAAERFEICVGKERILSSYQRQLVTGVKVNEKTNLSRSYINEIRAILANIDKFDWASQVARIQSIDELSSRNHLKSVNQSYRNVHDLQSFRKVLLGKILWLRSVRGKDDKTAKSLYDNYKMLVETGGGNAGACLKEKAYLNSNGCEIDRLDKEYSNQMAEISRIQDQNSLESYLCDNGKKIIEYGSLANVSMNEAKMRAKEIADSRRISLKAQAVFFGYFEDANLFKGLIHERYVGHADWETTVKNCNKKNLIYVRICQLPPHVAGIFKSFLDKCKSFAQSNPGIHGWDDVEFRNTCIAQFRKAVRFDYDGQACHFRQELAGMITKYLQDSPCKKIDTVGIKNKMFYTDTEKVLEAVGLILSSMISNSTTDSITISLDCADCDDKLFQKIELKIFEPDGMIAGENDIYRLFHGKLKAAIPLLRPLAEWHLDAKFDTGGFIIDVMANTSVPSERGKGILHRISFYQKL